MPHTDILQTNSLAAQVIENWLSAIKTRNLAELMAEMAPNVELSPPLEEEVTVGRENVLTTLKAFDQVVEEFSYHRVVAGNDVAILEFKGMINGTPLQGVDIFTLNAEQKIASIEVMARPLKAVQALAHAITKLRRDSQ